MSSDVLISFVVPVYNADKYLNECLDSIFDSSADESEYEAIAVDDGSTDSCPEILNTYVRHKNFLVISQKNKGPGGARNAGIDAARGKYICFIDSDDFLGQNAVSRLLSIARDSDQDIIEFDFQVTDWQGRPLAGESSQIGRTPRTGKGKDVCAKWHMKNFFITSACMRLFKRGLLTSNSLCFLPGIFREDFEWIIRCFFYADTFVYYPMIIYYYRRRTGSVCEWRDDYKTCSDIFEVIDSWDAFRMGIEQNEENSEYLLALGDTIPKLLDTAINIFIKSRKIKDDDRYKIFSGLVQRRHLLGLAVQKKRRRLYRLTRFMPARMAFRMYKIF